MNLKIEDIYSTLISKVRVISVASSKRNYALDFWKFVFSVIVVLFHSANLTDCAEKWVFVNGRIGVEFFFIVSGCMMAASLERSSQLSVASDTARFLKRKYLSLMPNAIIGSLICFVALQVAPGNNSVRTIIERFLQILPELFLIKACGLHILSVNGVTWYLSSMLLVMAIVYPIYKSHKTIFETIFAPVGFLLLMGYLYRTYGSLSNLESWQTYTSLANVRALADILGGIVCYQMVKNLRRFQYTFPMRVVFTAIEWFCYVLSIIYIYDHRPGKADFGIFALFMIAVAITVSQCGVDSLIFRSKVFAWLGKYSYSLYVGHSCWRKKQFAQAFYPATWDFYQRVAAYLILSFVSGLFIMYMSDLLRRIWNNVKIPLKTLIIKEQNNIRKNV